MSDTPQFKVCDACKNEIPINNFSLHEVNCLRHHYQCKTCLEFVAKSGREDHDHLYHSVEKCEKCGTKFTPIDEEKHISVCVNAILNCEFCESDFIRSKFREHKSACGARTEKCESCDKYVMLREMDNHVCNFTPQDFAVPVGTIISSSFRPELDVTARVQYQFSDYDISPPAQTSGTGTNSHREEKIQSLFSAKERHFPEPEPEPTGIFRRRNKFHETTEDTNDIFSIRASSKQLVDDYMRSSEPKREPMPSFDTSVYAPDPIPSFDTSVYAPDPIPYFDTSVYAPDPIPSESFLPLSPLEDRLPRDEESPTREYEPDPSGPCEFCGNQVPLSALDGHQLSCRHRNYLDRTETTFCVNCKSSVFQIEFAEHSKTCQPRKPELVFDRSIGPKQIRESKLKQEKPEPSSDLIPCQFCKQTFEISEISTHQDSCGNILSSYQQYGDIGMKQCRYCKGQFGALNLYTHQINCLSEQQLIRKQLREQKPQQQQQQLRRSFVESSNCEFCDEEFKVDELSQHSENCHKNTKNHCKHCLRYSSDPNHENICSYRHFNPKDVVHISDTKLPFSAIKGDTIIDPEPIDNKCPYCSFPYPALKLEFHKNRCANNPRYRRGVDRIGLGTTPRDEISKDTNTTIKGDFTPSIDPNTNKLREIYSENNFNLYSQRDPSPHVSKQQQVVASENLFASKQQQFTRRESPVSSFQDKYPPQNIRKQQQEPTKKGTLSPVLQFQQGTSKQQQQQATKKTSYSSTLPFQETYEQLNTSKQQQQQATKKTSYSSTLPFQETYEQLNTSKQQQQQPKRGIPSPTSLFRGSDEDKFAFSNMTTNPTDFKFEMNPIPSRRNPIDKPTELSLSNKQPNKYLQLTPTQDISNPFTRLETAPRPSYHPREIKYPPHCLSPTESYPKIISSPTETIIDTSIPSSSTTKRNSTSSFHEKYKSPKPRVSREFH